MSNFISKTGSVDLLENAELHSFQCCFDVDEYSDSFFPQLNIYFPDNLTPAVVKRRAEFLAGRYCASNCLERLGIRNFIIKPDNNRCPIWPADIKGSITHNQSVAIAAVSAQPSILGIGIDIESVINAKMVEEIKDQVLQKNEFGLLDLPYARKEAIFSLIFSIKESFFKAAYPSTGYYFGFEAVTIDNLNFSQNRFNLTLCQDLNPVMTKGSIYTGEFEFRDEQVLSMLVIR